MTGCKLLLTLFSIFLPPVFMSHFAVMKVVRGEYTQSLETVQFRGRQTQLSLMRAQPPSLRTQTHDRHFNFPTATRYKLG